MYTCSECGRAVGLFLDNNGNPRQFRCPHTGRLAESQIPIRRKPSPLTEVGREDVLRQLRLQGAKIRD